MPSFIRHAASWAGRHTFPVLAAAVIAVGAAGGGIGYAVASQHSTPIASTPAPSPSPSGGAAHRRKGAGSGIIDRALAMLAQQTGQSVASIRSQLAAGKSVDQVAGAQAPAIESEIMSAITKLADRAVAAGRITSAQEATDLAAVKTRLDALLAAPGTQLVADLRADLQFLHGLHGAPGVSPASPSPTPAA